MKRWVWPLVVLVGLGWAPLAQAQVCEYLQPSSERAPTANIPAPERAPALASVPAVATKPVECFATNWVRRQNSSWWGAVTYGLDRFVVVGSNSGITGYSFDGVSWTTAGSGMTGFQDVAYGDGMYVAVSGNTAVSNALLTSTNGVNWVSRPAIPVSLSWSGITYGNGLFVAVAASSTAVSPVMTSPDGINWTSRGADFDVAWREVIYANNQFVAVGDAAGSGATNGIMTSPDGITWTNRSGGSSFMNWLGLAYGKGLYVAAGAGGGAKIMTSPDGITWTNRTVPNNDLGDVVFGKDMFLAVRASAVLTSRDGISWTQNSVSTGGSGNLGGAAYGAGRFVIVLGAATGGIWVSDD